MREILFRGKCVEHGEWVEGSLIIEEPPLQCFPAKCPQIGKYLIGKSSAADWNMPRPFITTEVIPETVCQYTGLTDKNGNKIWEGDILKGGIFIEYEVKWDYEDCGWNITESALNFVVIGNIHDKQPTL